MPPILFSVIIPAYNEAQYLPKSLGALQKAQVRLGEPIEVIVADNLSTDATAAVAREFGARVVSVPVKCVSAVRNGGAAVATGKYLLFVDADNCVSEDLLVEIKRVMDTGEFVGGGLVSAHYDRDSLGLRLTHRLVKLSVALSGVSMFLFYTTRTHFDAIGGFNEKLRAVEDYDFARRLRAYGKRLYLRYCNLNRGHVVLSSRKFDEYGDWAVVRHPLQFLKACRNQPEMVDELWYKPRREDAAKR